MLKFLIHLPYRITGDSYELLQRYDADSRKKIMQLGWFVLTPTLLWFITGFLLSSQLLGHSVTASLITGGICCFFIFIVERSIILAKKTHWMLVLFRIILGLCVAFFGSALLDLVIFKGDIDHYARDKHISELQAKADSAIGSVNEASQKLNEEMRGTGGSRLRGYGMISEELKGQQEEARQRANQKEQDILHAQKVLSDPGHPEYEAMNEKLGMNTIAYRAELLHELLRRDSFKMTIMILLLIIGFLLEFMPILTKLGSKPTAYELDQEAIGLILTNRRTQALQRSNYHAQLGIEELMVQQAVNKPIKHPLL